MKITLKKGLSINKDQISKLQDNQMRSLKGGQNQVQNPSQSCSGCSCNNTGSSNAANVI
ncbi:class I lanthipeptide [Elizabethkingia ursingii]|uniref:class I lanthipeptide n=1 Tax=Elizabethkingia ursingii TaxID=1756150 RepID=UPI0020112583|nr:class I lanthipeptide [Elizabethkingia ursingii]MCL1665432.1 class I lanthipeptide [Elizabethkingia ursingii]